MTWKPDLEHLAEFADFLPVADHIDRPAWLAERSKGLGSSDAGTVLSVNQYSSRFRLWNEKTGVIAAPDLSDKEAIVWGKILEDVVARRWSELTGSPVWQPDVMFRSKERPWQLASPDRFALAPDNGDLALLEVKTASLMLASEWVSPSEGVLDKIPDKYEAQCYHQIAVLARLNPFMLGVRRMFIACLIGGQRMVWGEVFIDPDVLRDVVEAERRFWVDHVEANVPPAVDGSDDCTATLQEMWTDLSDVIEVGSDAIDMATEYWVAHEDAKEAESRKAEIGNRLRMMLGEYQVGSYGGQTVVSHKETKSGRVNWKALAEDMAFALGVPPGELITEKHRSDSSTRRLYVSKKLNGAF